MARTRARVSYILTVTSSLCLLVGWVVPFWFGRVYPGESKKQWGLFNVIICEFSRCRNEGGAIGSRGSEDAGAVDFAGGETDIQLLAIPVLATLAFVCCLLGLIAVLVIHYHCCGKDYRYHGYVWMAAGAQFMAGTFVLSTVIVHAVALGAFFSTTSVESVIEFPWSLLLYAIGGVLLTVSAILYTITICRWQKHKYIYSRNRYWLHRPAAERYSARLDPPPDYMFGGNSRRNHTNMPTNGRISFLEPPPDYMHVEFKTGTKAADKGAFRGNGYLANATNGDRRLIEASKTNGRRGNSADNGDVVTDVIAGDNWHVPWTYDWRAGRDYGSDIYAGDHTYMTYLKATSPGDDRYTHVIRANDKTNRHRHRNYDDGIILKPSSYEYYVGRGVNGRRSFDDYDAMRIARRHNRQQSNDWEMIPGSELPPSRSGSYLYSPRRGKISRAHTWYRT